MAVDAPLGPKGQPRFSADGAFEDWVDLGAVGDYAAEVGNRKTGTIAERNALPSGKKWEGMEWQDEDGEKDVYVYQSGNFIRRTPFRLSAQPGTMLAGTKPAVGQGIQLQTGSSVVTLNDSGEATVTFPAAFAHGVLVFLGENGDSTGFRTGNFALPYTSSLTQGFFRVYQPSGATAVAGTFRLNWFAFGW
jgi:hypothetical protein